MKLITSATFIAFSCLILSACGHHKDVRPGANGEHRVSVKADMPEDGSRDALGQANHYCKEFEKHAAIVKEQSKYVGSMDEESYLQAKRISKAAQFAGNTVKVHGGEEEKKVADLARLTSGTADSYLGKAYEVKMIFTCQ